MTVMLEHANLTVPNIEVAVRFLTTAFPEFQVRGSGVIDERRWLHIGTDDTYIALTESSKSKLDSGQLNHLGYVVDDVDALADRLLAAGYLEGFEVPPHVFRKRRYFFDEDGLEWEFVEYLSENASERNDYSE